jgi:DNA-binding beta-propeller fold protein YncE
LNDLGHPLCSTIHSNEVIYMLFKNRALFAMLTLVLIVVGCSSRPAPSSVASPSTDLGKPTPAPVTVPTATPTVTPTPTTAPVSESLLVTHSKSDYMSFLDPATGQFEKLTVGKAPFAIAVGPNHRAYISTAEGVAVVDTQQRKRVALVPYKAADAIGKPQFGEYRPGGMGIAVSPDGKFVYVGVYLTGRGEGVKSQLEIMDAEKLTMTGSVAVGVRPFDVVTSLDGREIYSIDHDSYSVTAVDPVQFKARTLEVAPFGKGGFEKPHYAAVRADGRLLLPYQGRGLVVLDPASGKYETKPLTGNTHQEGVALTADGKQLLIIGIGAAGSATGKPNLTVLDVETYAEKIFPLERMHQMVASADGRYAYLTGGVTYADTGWNGMTVVDLVSGAVRDFEVPDYPLDVQLLRE